MIGLARHPSRGHPDAMYHHVSHCVPSCATFCASQRLRCITCTEVSKRNNIIEQIVEVEVMIQDRQPGYHWPRGDVVVRRGFQ